MDQDEHGSAAGVAVGDPVAVEDHLLQLELIDAAQGRLALI